MTSVLLKSFYFRRRRIWIFVFGVCVFVFVCILHMCLSINGDAPQDALLPFYTRANDVYCCQYRHRYQYQYKRHTRSHGQCSILIETLKIVIINTFF